MNIRIIYNSMSLGLEVLLEIAQNPALAIDNNTLSTLLSAEIRDRFPSSEMVEVHFIETSDFEIICSNDDIYYADQITNYIKGLIFTEYARKSLIQRSLEGENAEKERDFDPNNEMRGLFDDFNRDWARNDD